MNINPNLLTGTRYFSGSNWVNLDISNYGLNYAYVPGFAVYCVSNQDWNGVSQYIKVYAGETYTFKTDSFYNDKTVSFAFGLNGKLDADFASPSLIQLDDITLGGGGINSLALYCLLMLSFLYNNVRR